jgi:hypothetical protein
MDAKLDQLMTPEQDWIVQQIAVAKYHERLRLDLDAAVEPTPRD